MQTSGIFLVPGGVTGYTVMNVMHGIRNEKDKKEESTEKNRAARAVTKAAEIAEQMPLGKATVDKLEAIEDNKKLEAVGNLTNPRMVEMLAMYRNTVKVQTAKEILQLDCIAALNASGVLKNGVVVSG